MQGRIRAGFEASAPRSLKGHQKEEKGKERERKRGEKRGKERGKKKEKDKLCNMTNRAPFKHKQRGTRGPRGSRDENFKGEKLTGRGEGAILQLCSRVPK